MSETKIEGITRPRPGVAGETEIEATIKQEPRQERLRRFVQRIVKSDRAKAPKGVMSGLFDGLQTVLGELSESRSISDITVLFNRERGLRIKSDRRTEAAGVLTSYLGEYDPDTGSFSGGLEAQSEVCLAENQKVLNYLSGTGETGYSDFSQVVERLTILYGEIHQLDKRFAGVNTEKGQKGKEYADLTQLTTKERRIEWISKTFGVEEDNVEELWNQAIVARLASRADAINGPRMWKDFVNSFKQVGYTDQVTILGLLQITEAQGIENFLADGLVVDKEGNNVAALVLGGEKLRGVSTQLYEIVMAFMDSASDRGLLRYETGVGIRIDNLSLRDRFLSRIGLDFGVHLPGPDANGDYGLTRFLIERYRPTVSAKINPWQELVARAKFETAFHDRYRGSVNTGQRLTDARLDRASYDNVANAETVRYEWFGMITGFREAVAQYTLDRSQPDSGLFNQMMLDAMNSRPPDLIMIQKLRRADTYAKQFLEMSGAPVDGFSADRDYTFIQIWDSVYSASSGPAREKLASILQVPLERLIEQKKFRYVLVDGKTGRELVMKFEGTKGVFVVSVPGNGLVSDNGSGRLQYQDNRDLADFMRSDGKYVQGGYWPEMEHAWGAGFNLLPRDYIEFCGSLSRSHLDAYHEREAGRRLGERWTGSERQKRVFIQFLAERKQAQGGTKWGIPFKREFGGPINPYDNRQLAVLARRLSIGGGPVNQKLIDRLADPATWDLYFNPTNGSSHLDGIESKRIRHGFDRFDKTVEWAFKSATELRIVTKTLTEFVSRGVLYKEGIWTGTTVRTIDKLVSEFWIHAKPWEAYESLTHVYQVINEEMTRELEKAIARPHEVSHAQLSKMFDEGLWRVAELTDQQKTEVLTRGTLDGERLTPLTIAETQQGMTILGRAMEIKGQKERNKLRVMVDQSLWRELAANPSVSLSQIYGKMIDEHMFEYCVPYLPEGDLERLYEYPALFAFLDFSDTEAYPIIDDTHPGFMAMHDAIVSSLFAIDSGRVTDTFIQNADNARVFDWNNMSAYGNQGWRIREVRQLTGLNNIMSIREQSQSRYDRCRRPNWTMSADKKEFSYMDETIVRFAAKYYGINLRNVREVAGLGPQFRVQFERIIANADRMIFAVYGVQMDRPEEIPSTYEFYMKQTLQPFYDQYKDFEIGKSVLTPGWFEEIPAITDATGAVLFEAITYKKVVGELAKMRMYDPVYGPWLEAHITIDNSRVLEVSSLEFKSPESSVFSAIVPTLDYLKGVADLPNTDNLPYNIEKKFLPQVERYALTYLRKINIEGREIILDARNIRRYVPEIMRQFKEGLKTGAGEYNYNFVSAYLNLMYGVNIQVTDATRGWEELKEKIKADDELGEHGGSSKGYGGYIDHLESVITKMRTAAEKKYTIGQRAALGLGSIPDNEFLTQLIYLSNLREKLRFSIAGPAEWFKIIRRVQDRNENYFTTGYILPYKTQYLPIGDKEKMELFNQFRQKADIETVLIADENIKRTVARASSRLKNVFRLNDSEMKTYIGKVEARGIEDLRGQLYAPEGSSRRERLLNWPVNRVKLYNWSTYAPLGIGYFLFETIGQFIPPIKQLAYVEGKYIEPKPNGYVTALAGDAVIAIGGAVASAVATGNPFILLQAIGQFNPGVAIAAATIGSLGSVYAWGMVHMYVITPATNRIAKSQGIYVANRDEAAGYFQKQ